MGFDPLTLLTISVIALVAMGGLMVFLSQNDPDGAALRWWGIGFLVGAGGLILLMQSPTDALSLEREAASAVFLLTYGLMLAGCRTFNGRPAMGPSVFTGSLLWFGLCWGFNPPVAVRFTVMGCMIALSCWACAWELWPSARNRSRGPRATALVFAVHGCFYLSRIALAPIVHPHGPPVTKTASLWGALLGAETLAFVFIFGYLAIAMTRECTAVRLRKASMEDVLTGIGNRRFLLQDGQALLDSRGGRELALILFDLDHFKSVNDTHGHAAGDRVLVQFATLAVANLPSETLFCRIGGEEFAALLPTTGDAEARAQAQLVRRAFEQHATPGRGGPIKVTVSAGVAVSNAHDLSIEELMSRADINLYRAKARGRNRVEDEALPAPGIPIGGSLSIEDGTAPI